MNYQHRVPLTVDELKRRAGALAAAQSGACKTREEIKVPESVADYEEVEQTVADVLEVWPQDPQPKPFSPALDLAKPYSASPSTNRFDAPELNEDCAPSDDLEIPWAVAEAIASWRRILEGSKQSAVLVNFKTAVVELHDVARVYGDPVVDVVSSTLVELGIAAGFADAAVLIDEAMTLAPSISTKLDAGTSGWPAPTSIKSTLPPVEKFIPELLPDALRDYVLDVADRQQAPPDFAAVAAICAIAAIVGNRIRIHPKRNDDWEVVPNLWGANVGRPSAMKSPAMQAALAPLYAIQDGLRERWEEENKRAEIDEALSGLDAKDAKKKAEKALKDGDRDGARGILAGLIDGNDGEPPCPRIIINDATVEKVGELLNQNPRGVFLIRDELPGFLARMESEEYQSERAFYLEAYNGNSCFTYDRIGRGTIHIETATISIVGNVQPSRIAPVVRRAMSGASNDGLIQRLQMVVWPDDVGSWRWVDRTPNTLARLAYEKVFRDLYDLSIGDSDKPAVLRFSPAAQNLFREWMEEIQAEARGGSLPSTLESHILKMPKTMASLALLFELIDGGRSEVNEPATRRALGWAEYLRSHANRLYSSGETMAEDGARLIVERRHQLPEQFTGRNVHQKGWAGLGDRDTVAASIEILIATNHCREVNGMAATGGGRPTSLYFWNPALQAGG
jgi:hypothetical protein